MSIFGIMTYKQYILSVASRFINDQNLNLPIEIELSESIYHDESSLLSYILDISQNLSYSIDSSSMNYRAIYPK